MPPKQPGPHSPRPSISNAAPIALPSQKKGASGSQEHISKDNATPNDLKPGVAPAAQGVSFGEELSLRIPGDGQVIQPAERPTKPKEVTYSNIDFHPTHGSVEGPTQPHSKTASVDFVAPESNGNERSTAAEATATPPAGDTASKESAEKIVRLSRLVQGLKQKLERLQGENVQLEEMLAAADAAHRGGSGEISRLEDELAREQAARISLEAALSSAINAKESEVVSLRQQLEAATTRAATLADALAAKEAERAAADAERTVSESQLIATLRKEVEVAEATLEEERKAHAAARRASAAREHELDATVADAAASLAEMQRMVDERTSKAAVAEERCRELEHEVETLSQRVLAAETRAETANPGATSGTSDTSSAAQRVQELEATLQEVRRAQAAAQDAAASASEECTRLRAEVETLRRQLAEAARSSDSAELRKRLQEATDALYAKQAQLERAAADRAATQLQLERQMSAVSVDTLKRRTAAVDRMLSGAEDGYGIVPMDSLGDAYTRLANAPGHLGHAVKAGANFLDSTASQAVRILRHYPLGRLAAFCYIIGMHFFIYLLLHRLQRHAFGALVAAEEAAALGNHSV